jgi:hypothetical protein
MVSDSDPVTIENLLAQLNPSRSRLESFVGHLNETQLTTPFGRDGWSV